MDEVATYDVAVSFAEEQRTAAEKVVEACRQRGLTVLHDPGQTHEWWEHSEDLPRAQVRFFLPFLSTVDEFGSAVLRAVKDGHEHVLPVLLDDVTVPAELLHPHVAYLRAAAHQTDQLTEALANRVEATEAAGRDRAPVSEIVTRVKRTGQQTETAPTASAVPANFSRYAEQDAALRYLGEQFTAAMPGLSRRGYTGTVHIGDTNTAIRVERTGDTVYALDIQRGGIGGDETLNFVVGRHDRGSACSNGWARPVHDNGTAALELHDLSVLGGGDVRIISREELFNALWQRIDSVLAATA